MNKKEYLDWLYYVIGKQQEDFWLCHMHKTPEGETVASKWSKYSEIIMPLNPWESNKIKNINNRSILKNEIVLDIEDPSEYPQILESLKELGFSNFIVYKTGSRGYHIHIFFKDAASVEVKEKFILWFGADIAKSGEKVMIALENCPHWKTGNIKEEIKWN